MSLPKIDLPTYKVKLKTIEQEVYFRPFLVKEEKMLLMALESSDFNSVLEGIKQVIRNCLLTEIDVESLPMFDLEFLFLNLRARSMGEKVEITYICQNIVQDKKCGGEMDVEVDLLKAAIESTPINSTIKITDKVGIKLKYPTIEISKILNTKLSDIDTAVELIEKCTEYLFDEEQTYKPSDMAEGEFKSFIENLTQEQFIAIQSFFNNIPKIKYDTEVTCERCNTSHKIHLEGILDFFE